MKSYDKRNLVSCAVLIVWNPDDQKDKLTRRQGVGFGFNPPKPLVVGDVVRCEIDGIGEIQNRIVAETSSDLL